MKNLDRVLIAIVILFLFQSCLDEDNNIVEEEYTQRVIPYDGAKIIGDTLFRYYSNGNVKVMQVKDTILNKKVIYDYNNNGNIKSYTIARYLKAKNMNDAFFVRRYSEDNKTIIDTGAVIGLIINEDDKLITKDTLFFDILMARPPNCIYYLIAEIGGSTEKDLKLNNNIAKFWFIADTSGVYKLGLHSALKDTLRDTVVTSDVFLNLKVY